MLELEAKCDTHPCSRFYAIPSTDSRQRYLAKERNNAHTEARKKKTASKHGCKQCRIQIL